MSAPLNGDELLAKINPVLPQGKAHICLRPDLIAKWEAASEELVEAQSKKVTGRLAASAKKGDPRKLAQVVQKIEAEIEAASVWFHYEALPKEEFQKLTAKYGPRKSDQFDMIAGYNREAVHGELVRVCLVDPQFSDEGWDKLVAKLAQSEWNELQEKAVGVNGELMPAPKSQLASQILAPRSDGSE